jgi:hypothetical protein
MEQYPVPQFIEQESKIAFFMSFRQFFYLLAGGAVCFLLFYILPFYLFVIFGGLTLAITGGFAFISVNGVPLLDLVLASIGFASGGKDYTWKKKESPYPFKTFKRAVIKKIDQGPVLKAQDSQLRRTRTAVELKTK